MKRIFVDSDIFLDVIFDRPSFSEYSAKVFDLVASGEIEIFTSVICVSNMLYLTSKKFGKLTAKKILIELKPLFKVCPTTNSAIEQSLNSSFSDLEDAFQYYTAIENRLELLITRNIKDYPKLDLPVLTPIEFFDSVS